MCSSYILEAAIKNRELRVQLRALEKREINTAILQRLCLSSVLIH